MYKQYHKELQRSLYKLKNGEKKKETFFLGLKEKCVISASLAAPNGELFERPNITNLAVYLNNLFENS